MTDVELLTLLSRCESALEAGERAIAIARALAQGYRSGVHPPDVVLEAYFASFERDEALLAETRRKIEQMKSERQLLTAGS